MPYRATVLLRLRIAEAKSSEQDDLFNGAFACQHCQDDLLISQPDPDDPDHLVGVCVACKAWYLIERSGTDPRTVLPELPEHPMRGSPPPSATVPLIEQAPSARTGS